MTGFSLVEFIRFVRTNSRFYRDLYAAVPGDVNGLAELPVVDHSAYWAANALDSNRLLTGPHTDGIVVKTGGTTDSPRPATLSILA